MIGACVGVFFLAIITEFVKALRQAMQLTNCRVFCRSIRLGLGRRARGPMARAGGSSSTTIDCCATPATAENPRVKGLGVSAPESQSPGGGPVVVSGETYLRPPDHAGSTSAQNNLIAAPITQ